MYAMKEDDETVEEYTDEIVRILPGNEFYTAQEQMRRYLLGVDDDRMLYHFRRTSGLDTLGAENPGGWESDDGKLRGHTTGHYLSALALCFHSTGDKNIREKAEYMVRELGKCQDAFAQMDLEGYLSGYPVEQFDLLEAYTPYPEIWAPYYTFHKIMAGLLDCRKYISSEKAFGIAEKMGTWVWRKLGRLPRSQLEKMWSLHIAGEYGGMNAVLAQLAGITGKEEYIRCAKLFDNDRLMVPLSRGLDRLSGLHANQHIPQMLGAVEIYKVTGKERYLDMAKTFWRTVTQNRSYATGGVGENEMFHGFREIGSYLTGKTQETCASYNMLKLTEELYRLDRRKEYMDYYERTLLNHIMATPERGPTGESVYFLPLGPGMKREFLRENSCCHGTGMESRFRYREGIYLQERDELYLNLYIPSELSSDSGKTAARIERLSRREQRYRIFLGGEKLRRAYLRKPGWAQGYRVEEIRGKAPVIGEDRKGYLFLEGDFSDGIQVTVQWEPGYQIIRAPDMPERAAVQYGPYVLAALSEETDFISVTFDESSVSDEMKWEENVGEDELRFRCGGRIWIPLCDIDDHAYHVYVICEEDHISGR